MSGLEFSTNLRGVARCPHCGVTNPLLSEVWSSKLEVIGDLEHRQLVQKFGVFRCSKCSQAVLAQGQVAALAKPYPELDEIAALYPSPPTVDKSLPESAKLYLEQAFNSLSAPDAATLMAASAVDSMLKEIGYEEGDLYRRIDKAVEEHKLTSDMGKWAHKVRLGANNVRHADAAKPHATPEEARQAVEFAKALGDFLFVFTARVSEGLEEAESSSDA